MEKSNNTGKEILKDAAQSALADFLVLLAWIVIVGLGALIGYLAAEGLGLIIGALIGLGVAGAIWFVLVVVAGAELNKLFRKVK